MKRYILPILYSFVVGVSTLSHCDQLPGNSLSSNLLPSSPLQSKPLQSELLPGTSLPSNSLLPLPPKVDFFTSMGWYYKTNKTIVTKDFLAQTKDAKKQMERLKALEGLYNKNDFSQKDIQGAPKIPKIIHQIWVGPNQPPAVFKESQESVKRLHPGWEYKLWTDADIPGFGMHNQKYYDLSKNYGEKADILRYEILYRYGGIYLDIDYICLKPFDVLLQYDVWASILPLNMGGHIANGIIGSVPGHPLLRDCVATLKNDWHAYEKHTQQIGVLLRVGPRHFEKSFMKFINNPSAYTIALPTSYFYPIAYRKRTAALGLKMKGRDQLFKKSIRPESFAVHCWATSWWPRKKKKGRHS